MGPRRNYLMLLTLVGMALLPFHVVPFWVSITLAVGPMVVLAIWRRISPPPPPRLIIDETGVLRDIGRGKVERIAWKDLVEIGIITTSDGPFGDDFYWVLKAADGTGCAVPSTRAEGLLARLQRLPGFDNEQVVKAAGSVTEAGFPCWKGSAGEGLVCGGAIPSETPP